MVALLMLSPAPVVEAPGDDVLLDVDFVEGMKLHCQFWPGPVCCVLRRGAKTIPGGRRYSLRRLGFGIVLLDADEALPEALINEASLVYCSADDMRYLQLPRIMNGRPSRLVYTLENAPGLRLSGVFADQRRSFWGKLRSALWVAGNEPALRRALRAADGLQFNGFPAQSAYRRLHQDTHSFLDSRLRTPMLARAADQDERANRLRNGAPLTLVHVGPLERESGVGDLLQMAFLLNKRGVNFRMELLGDGSLAHGLRDAIAAWGLNDRVSLTGSPGFDGQLLPHLRRKADLLLVARRSADPLPIYIEAMGCGVPVLGYANAMWRRLQAVSAGGWASRGNATALFRALSRLEADREAIIRASQSALDFARGHTFEQVFARRMAHLRAIAGLE